MAVAALILIAGAAAVGRFAMRPGPTWTNPLENAQQFTRLTDFDRLRIGRRAVTGRKIRHFPF